MSVKARPYSAQWTEISNSSSSTFRNAPPAYGAIPVRPVRHNRAPPRPPLTRWDGGGKEVESIASRPNDTVPERSASAAAFHKGVVQKASRGGPNGVGGGDTLAISGSGRPSSALPTSHTGGAFEPTKMATCKQRQRPSTATQVTQGLVSEERPVEALGSMHASGVRFASSHENHTEVAQSSESVGQSAGPEPGTPREIRELLDSRPPIYGGDVESVAKHKMRELEDEEEMVAGDEEGGGQEKVQGDTVRARFERVDWDRKGYVYRHELSAALRDDPLLSQALWSMATFHGMGLADEGVKEAPRLQCEAVFRACGAERTLTWDSLSVAMAKAQ